jgi:hydroxyacylglutathione hydrolase
MRVRHLVDSGLGNSAYLVISERHGVGALIDPLRDVDQYQVVAQREGVRITHVFETHLHNDFQTGGPDEWREAGGFLERAASAVTA